MDKNESIDIDTKENCLMVAPTSADTLLLACSCFRNLVLAQEDTAAGQISPSL